MNIKIELLKIHIADYIISSLNDLEIDASQIADTTATQMLSEIQKVIGNKKYSDFDAIEKIICIFINIILITVFVMTFKGGIRIDLVHLFSI